MITRVPISLKAICFIILSFTFNSSFAQCLEASEGMESNFNSNDMFGQSFPACMTGVLTQLDIPVHTFNPGTCNAELYIFDGEGYDGDTLYQEDVIINESWDIFHEYVLAHEVEVEEGSQYTIALKFDGTYCGWWAIFQNQYPQGKMYWNPGVQENYDFNFKAHFGPSVQENIWIGLVSSDWHDEENWSLLSVPDQNSIAVIPMLTDNYLPIIGSDADVKTLKIFDGGSLVLDIESELKIYNTLMNYGTAEFHGMVNIVNATYEAEILGNNEFSHLKINNTVFLTEPVMVTDLLDLSSGYLMNMGSNLKVSKTEDTKGHVYYPDNNVMGNIIIERKYDKNRGTRLISSPVEDAILGDIGMSEMEQSDDKTFNQLSIRSYDEGESGNDFKNGWVVHSSSDTPLRKGLGYAADFPGGATLSFDGEVSSQSHTINASYTSSTTLMNNGWHLLGNPYPSILDWESIEGGNELDNAIYFWNNSIQQFEIYLNDVSTFYADRYIQPMEGFFVHTGTHTSVDVEYDEAAISPDQVFQDALQEVWTMPLYRLGVKNDDYIDETLLLFSVFGKDEYQGDLDAYKMMSLNDEAPSIATVNPEGDFFAINTIPELQGQRSIPLYTEFPVSGEYTFGTKEMINFPTGDEVYLEDKYTGKFHNLSEGSVSIDIGANSKAKRFVLHFGLKNSEEIGTDLAEVFTNENDIIINVTEEGNYQVEVYSAIGQKVYNNPFSNKDNFLRVSTEMGAGTYMVKIFNEEYTQVEKVFIK